jgi:hypothetical protein
MTPPQYGSATPVQKMITTGKGVAIDFDSVSRDGKAHSKELYMWGQEEDVDIKDGWRLFSQLMALAADPRCTSHRSPGFHELRARRSRGYACE